ncbi:PilC/PilY family type IV pilus protein [Variovorax sp. J22R133]|uniref:pilus assembly protein n=1 Tax=Variovorax brevis TaxID=3053503 RepID=UPI00257591A4|nr:PilC/PilY family type IV pilus protein [Variovorax sp. J22R133]MDM0112680.1 PilC/PilY family type IV pilus protein [Variovorax sp. J22R133]
MSFLVHAKQTPKICALLATCIAPLASTAQPAATGALAFSTAPAVVDGKWPAPNVIVSIDNAMGDAAARTRLRGLQAALREGFAAANAPQDSIRLAWQASRGCSALPGSGALCAGHNGMRTLDDAHRRNFMAFVDQLDSELGNDVVSTRTALLKAGDYLARSDLGPNSPWAALPGSQLTPALACRKTYMLLAASGAGLGELAGASAARFNTPLRSMTLPDGTPYDATSAVTAIYREGAGSNAGAESPSAAELAFHYWATDLQSALKNEVQPTIASPSQYWNPQYDPAPWQHLSIHAIGPTAEDPALAQIAINSRGSYHATSNASEQTQAVKSILQSIAADRRGRTIAASSMVASASTTRNDTSVFAARYDVGSWSGDITSFTVARGASTASAGPWGAGATGQATTTATLLDAMSPDARVIVTSQSQGAELKGVGWRWDHLTTAQQAALGFDGSGHDASGARRLLYLRGDRSGETAQGGSFRDRASRQGDSVNSRLWYAPGKPSSGYFTDGYDKFRAANASRASMLYVGANDGMLHGFDAATGAEKIAYVPQGVYAGMSQLTNPAYLHRYFVDGSPFTGDLLDGKEWRTWLTGTLGAGGKGYFVLDVTDPGAFAEANAARLVKLDTTGSSDPDIGHIFGEPTRDQANSQVAQQITRMNNGRWALVMGNGYNSTNGNAVLLIQYLDANRELQKIAAGGLNGNGLATPRLVDFDGDRIPDVAYAGDLRGQLWKFDLGSAKSNEWSAAGGRPLYAATDASGKPQPITAAPVWFAHPDGGVMVVFGTGRLLTDADRSDTSVQSVYGIYDSAPTSRTSRDAARGSGSSGAPVPAGRGSLVQQAISGSAAGSVGDQSLWSSSTNTVPYSGTGARKGWYLDLPVPGERVVSNLEWFEGKLIDVPSMVPLSQDAQGASAHGESCEPPRGRSFLTTLHAVEGARPKSRIYGASESSFNASRIDLGGKPGVRLRSFGKEHTVTSTGASEADRQRLGHVPKTPSWHQLQ